MCKLLYQVYVIPVAHYLVLSNKPKIEMLYFRNVCLKEMNK